MMVSGIIYEFQLLFAPNVLNVMIIMIMIMANQCPPTTDSIL